MKYLVQVMEKKRKDGYQSDTLAFSFFFFMAVEANFRRLLSDCFAHF